MAVRKAAEPIQKHTLNLFAGDYDRLSAIHPTLGAGRVIRDLVRAYIRKIEQEAGTCQTLENYSPEIPLDIPETIST